MHRGPLGEVMRLLGDFTKPQSEYEGNRSLSKNMELLSGRACKETHNHKSNLLVVFALLLVMSSEFLPVISSSQQEIQIYNPQ